MQAIITKYHGPTNTRGSRMTAQCGAGKISIPYPHELNFDECHAKAARTLLSDLGWTKADGYDGMVGGQIPSGDYVWVFEGKLSPRASVKA